MRDVNCDCAEDKIVTKLHGNSLYPKDTSATIGAGQILMEPPRHATQRRLKWVVMIRIQRTGSTSVGELIWNLAQRLPNASSCGFGACPCQSQQGARTDHRITERSPVACSEAPCWQRHCGYSSNQQVILAPNAPHLYWSDALRLLPPPGTRDALWLTFLRDPVRRTLSEVTKGSWYELLDRPKPPTNPFGLLVAWDYSFNLTSNCGKSNRSKEDRQARYAERFMTCETTRAGSSNRMTHMLTSWPHIEPMGMQVGMGVLGVQDSSSTSRSLQHLRHGPCCDEADLRSAVENLELTDWFGVLECQEQSVFLLRRLFAVQADPDLPRHDQDHVDGQAQATNTNPAEMRLGHLNAGILRGPARASSRDPSTESLWGAPPALGAIPAVYADIVPLIRAANELDLQLHAFAVRLLNQRLRQARWAGSLCMLAAGDGEASLSHM